MHGCLPSCCPLGAAAMECAGESESRKRLVQAASLSASAPPIACIGELKTGWRGAGGRDQILDWMHGAGLWQDCGFYAGTRVASPMAIAHHAQRAWLLPAGTSAKLCALSIFLSMQV